MHCRSTLRSVGGGISGDVNMQCRTDVRLVGTRGNSGSGEVVGRSKSVGSDARVCQPDSRVAGRMTRARGSIGRDADGS